MIIFDQLRISDDGKKMYINAHVNMAEYFKKVYIDSVVIMTADKVSETAPGTPTSNYIYMQNIKGEEKELNLVLTAADFVKTWEKDSKAMTFNQADMGRTLFFVYVKCKGTPGANTPCRLDEETNLGVVFYENILYQKVMDYTRELLKDCKVPVGLMDFILLWNAFKAAVETEHYIKAIKFFGMLFDNMKHTINAKGCGCYG